MAEVSDAIYSLLIDVQNLPGSPYTARESQQISEWMDIARSREDLSPAGTREVQRLADKLRTKYGDRLAEARRPAPAPGTLAAASAAATRAQERNDPFTAQLNDSTRARNAAAASASGTGNS